MIKYYNNNSGLFKHIYFAESYIQLYRTLEMLDSSEIVISNQPLSHTNLLYGRYTVYCAKLIDDDSTSIRHVHGIHIVNLIYRQKRTLTQNNKYTRH